MIEIISLVRILRRFGYRDVTAQEVVPNLQTKLIKKLSAVGHNAECLKFQKFD